MDTKLEKWDLSHKEEIKSFFLDVFTREPWNDDWSDEEQLENYITDLTGNRNSLTLAYLQDGKLAALAMGRIKHWYEATEYCIDELCVRTCLQGQGTGGRFLQAMERYLKAHGIRAIFLLTEKDVPAYGFYKKQGFAEQTGNVAFAKWL